FVREMHWRLKSRSSAISDRPEQPGKQRKKATLADLVTLQQARLKSREDQTAQLSGEASSAKVALLRGKNLALAELSFMHQTTSVTSTQSPSDESPDSSLKAHKEAASSLTKPLSGQQASQVGETRRVARGGNQNSSLNDNDFLDAGFNLDAELNQFRRFGLSN
uniref:Pre-mRNA-splicing factor SYF2 n=1 Tax=Macrostomum lignano TaxID=282301 RepID=A0A1I8JA96_9PLAT